MFSHCIQHECNIRFTYRDCLFKGLADFTVKDKILMLGGPCAAGLGKGHIKAMDVHSSSVFARFPSIAPCNIQRRNSVVLALSLLFRIAVPQANTLESPDTKALNMRNVFSISGAKTTLKCLGIPITICECR